MTEEGFDAVFIGSGAGLPVFLGIPGENLNGVYSANEFLTRVNLMRAYEFPTSDTPVWRGRKVAVVGGGNVAMDAARTALRLGAEEVFLVYRRTEDEMPARREEVHHAERGGRRVQDAVLAARDRRPRRLGDRASSRRAWSSAEPDASGRRAPVCVHGLASSTIDCDTVIIGGRHAGEPAAREGRARPRAHAAAATSSPTRTARRTCRASSPAATSSPARRPSSWRWARARRPRRRWTAGCATAANSRRSALIRRFRVIPLG